MTLWLWLPVILIVCLALGAMALTAVPRRNRPDDCPVAEDSAPAAAGWLPLAQCPRDCSACLRCLEVDHCVVHRLRELGLTPGVELRVVQDAGGPLLVSVRGSRVAVGRDLAEKIWVELPPAGEFCRF